MISPWHPKGTEKHDMLGAPNAHRLPTDASPKKASTKLLAARRRLICCLHADDELYSQGTRPYCGCLEAAPIADGARENDEFNSATGLQQRYPTLPPHQASKAFVPTVSMPANRGFPPLDGVLGEFDQHWRTAFDFNYYQAFHAFPHRIGYPYLGRTRA